MRGGAGVSAASPQSHTTPLHYSTQLRRVFEYGSFNRMQSRMMDKVLHTNNNIVVSAPTGSGDVAVCVGTMPIGLAPHCCMASPTSPGKTGLIDLAIVAHLQRHSGTSRADAGKVVFVAPTTALCEERFKDWYATTHSPCPPSRSCWHYYSAGHGDTKGLDCRWHRPRATLTLCPHLASCRPRSRERSCS